jgi:hypothetical protein
LLLNGIDAGFTTRFNASAAEVPAGKTSNQIESGPEEYAPGACPGANPAGNLAVNETRPSALVTLAVIGVCEIGFKATHLGFTSADGLVMTASVITRAHGLTQILN